MFGNAARRSSCAASLSRVCASVTRGCPISARRRAARSETRQSRLVDLTPWRDHRSGRLRPTALAALFSALDAAVKACVLKHVAAKAELGNRRARLAAPCFRRKRIFQCDAFNARRCCDRLRAHAFAAKSCRAARDFDVVPREIEWRAAKHTERWRIDARRPKSLNSHWR